MMMMIRVLWLASVVSALTPPVLPTSWKARTIDPPQAEGVEMYHFVDPDVASSTNPSGHWFEYPGCSKLEYYTRKDAVNTKDYYLGCYSVDCCYEDRGSGIKEWQIDGGASYVGRHLVESFGDVVSADGWSVVYHAFPERINYTYWVEGATLHRIDVVVSGPVPITTNIQYRDFTSVEDSPEFVERFQIPDVCKGNHVNRCPEDDDSSRGAVRRGAMDAMRAALA